jgi:cytochrome d ubiquinol oxidase subunit II
VVTGALVPGGLDPAAADYPAAYLAPWLRPFPLTLGVFTVCLFAFLAAVYLIGESPAGNLRRSFARKAFWSGAITIACGAVVFGAASLDGVPLLHAFLSSRAALSAALLATVLLPWLGIAVARDWIWSARMLAGAQVALILAGWFRVQYPVLVRMPGGDLTFFNSHAPAATLNQLAGALLVGSVFILPALAWLFRVFKTRGSDSWDSL